MAFMLLYFPLSLPGLYLVLNVILVRVAVYYNMRKEKRARSKSASPYARSAGAAGWAKLNVFTVSRSSAEPIVATELGVSESLVSNVVSRVMHGFNG